MGKNPKAQQKDNIRYMKKMNAAADKKVRAKARKEENPLSTVTDVLLIRMPAGKKAQMKEELLAEMGIPVFTRKLDKEVGLNNKDHVETMTHGTKGIVLFTLRLFAMTKMEMDWKKACIVRYASSVIETVNHETQMDLLAEERDALDAKVRFQESYIQVLELTLKGEKPMNVDQWMDAEKLKLATGVAGEFGKKEHAGGLQVFIDKEADSNKSFDSEESQMSLSTDDITIEDVKK